MKFLFSSRMVLVGSILLMLAAVVSCKRQENQIAAPPVEKRMTIALDGNPTTFDPVQMTEVLSAAVGNAIHAPLMRIDPQGKLVPVLANSIAVAADGLSATISINSSAKFWDGSPVTAADVEFSLRRLQTSSSVLKWICDRISEFEQKNNREIVVRFREPEPDFAKLIANLQASIVKTGSDKLPKKPFDSQIVGAGAFVPVDDKMQPGVEFTMKANPGFPRRGNVDVLTFTIIPDPQNQFEAFRSGKADIIRLRGPALAETCALGTNGQLQPKPEFPGAKVVQAPASELVFMVLNYSNPKLADISKDDRGALIAALSAKLERNPLVKSLYLGMADPAVGIVPPSALALPQSAPTALPNFKLQTSKKLVLLAANDPSSRQFATFLQTQFKQIGLEFDLQFVELPKLAESVIKHDFEAAVPWFEMPVAGIGPWTMFFEEGNPFSIFGQGLPGIKEKLQAARSILDEAARNQAYAEVVSDINSRQQAWLPIVSRRTVLLENHRTDGAFIDVCGTPVWSFLKVNE